MSSAPIAFIHLLPICPRHPGKGTPVPWEVHQAADLLLCAHGTLTPPRFSRGCPHCVIPEPRGCDWAEVSLYPFPPYGRRRVQTRHLQLVCTAPGGLQRQNLYVSLPARSWRTPAKAHWEIVQNVPDEMHIRLSRSGAQQLLPHPEQQFLLL